MKYYKYKCSTLLLNMTIAILLLVSCSDDSNTNKITVIKSERSIEKHQEVIISKNDESKASPTVTRDSFKEITETHKKKVLTEVTTLSLKQLTNSSTNLKYGISKNQNEIAQSILSRFNNDKNSNKRPLRIAYFNPSDREPVPGYQERIQKIMLELQSFYGKGMEQNGFGYRTFNLEINDSKLKIHFIQNDKPKSSFARNSNTSKTIYSEVARTLKESDIQIENETVIVFQNLARIKGNSFFDTDAPYYGTWNTNINRKGFCYVVDSEFLDWNNLTKTNSYFKFNGSRTMSLGELASVQIGGVCHELGHAFCLNHTHNTHSQNKKSGTALMGYGNWTFKQELRKEGKGTYLSFITAAKLMGHPSFSSIKNNQSNLQLTDISFNPMTGMLEIRGQTLTTSEIYAVIAYCDNLNKRSDYDASGWVGGADKSGNFQISINELEANQPYTVNLQLLHTNGKESSKQINFKTNSSGTPVLEKLTREKLILNPIIIAKLNNNIAKAVELSKTLKSANKDKYIHFLTNTLNIMDPNLIEKAGDIPASIDRVFLSQVKWDLAYTGYSKARANRVHEEKTQKPWPFLMSNNNIHRFGLYGHAHSEYTFDLEQKWKTLSGMCSLRKNMKGSVQFIIKGDGKELYNSGIVKDDNERQYNLDIEEIKTIKLIISDSGDGKNSDWGQWLSPLLSR